MRFLFSLFINDVFSSLLSSVSCSLYADDLATWSTFSSITNAMEDYTKDPDAAGVLVSSSQQ